MLPTGTNDLPALGARLVPRGGTLAPVRDEPVLKGGAFSLHSLVPVAEPALKAFTNRR